MKTRALVLSAILIAAMGGGGSAGATTEGLPPRVDLGATDQNSFLRISGAYTEGVMGLTCSAGDINGDGIDDAIFGALRNDPKNQTNGGMVYVVFGSEGLKRSADMDMSTPPAGVLRLIDTNTEDQFGRSVAINDLNGDGYGDIIASAWHASPYGRTMAGTVYVIFGSASLSSEESINVTVPRPDIITISAQTAGEELGTLLFTGDVNGDGFADGIIGAYNASTHNLVHNGKTYVVFGSADMKTRGSIDMRDSTRVMVIHGAGNGDQFGYHVTSGDLNNDGCDETIIGARLADFDGRENAGKAYILFGDTGMNGGEEINLADSVADSTVKTVQILGANTWDLLSDRMNTGDVNGDGFDDLFIGASGYDDNTGVVYVLMGSGDVANRGTIDIKSNPQGIVTILGEHQKSFLHMPFPADINNDGIDDAIVAAHSTYRSCGCTPYGAIYIRFGSTDFSSLSTIDLSDDESTQVKIIGGNANAYLGISAFTGDFDGDGCKDIVIGASNSDPSDITNAGMVYLIWGSPYAGTPFTFTTATGDSATVLIKKENIPNLNGTPISAGDAIAAVTSSGLCAGVGIWTGDDLSFTIWGDDPQNEHVVGFAQNEEVSFLLWKKRSGMDTDPIELLASTPVLYQSGAVIEAPTLSKSTVLVSEPTPESFSLLSNYPNPFNPSTTIPFTVSQTTRVVITIYSAVGTKVATLTNDTYDAGKHEVVWNSAGCAAGVYFCRIQAGNYTKTAKMTLLK